jgi:hypothetical protein
LFPSHDRKPGEFSLSDLDRPKNKEKKPNESINVAFGKKKDNKKEGVVTRLQRRKITTYKTMDEAGMLSEQGRKEMEKLRLLYPSMFN